MAKLGIGYAELSAAQPRLIFCSVSLDDPTFSLSEELSFKTAAGLLMGMGLGFEALIRAFFIILSGFGSALGGAAGA